MFYIFRTESDQFPVMACKSLDLLIMENMEMDRREAEIIMGCVPMRNLLGAHLGSPCHRQLLLLGGKMNGRADF